MPGSSDPWLYSYRDDSPSPSPPKAVPKPRVPQTQMDCILAEAELDGLDSLAGRTDREVIDIGEVEEKVVYNDNPFRIAARQAMSKRVRAGDDQSGPERVGPKVRPSSRAGSVLSLSINMDSSEAPLRSYRSYHPSRRSLWVLVRSSRGFSDSLTFLRLDLSPHHLSLDLPRIQSRPALSSALRSSNLPIQIRLL
jgi:hypothetical protein